MNKMETLNIIKNYIADRGFNARITNDHVEVEIPWTNAKTNQTGIDKIKVKTIKEARLVLGY